jgi:hypothetical protein
MILILGCLFVVLLIAAPRIALGVLWLTTDLVSKAFDFILWPILGLIFVPFTTLLYVFLYNTGKGVEGWEWLIIALGVLVDLGFYGSGTLSNRDQISKLYGRSAESSTYT